MKNNLAQKFNYYSLIRYSAPATIMLVFMSLYQLVDGVFVANIVGDNALSALNMAYPAISLMVSVSIMLASGGVAIVSKKMGENKYDEARNIFTMIIIVGILFSFGFALLVNLKMDAILSLLGVNEVLYESAKDYLSILGTMAIVAVLQMMFQFFFVCAGKSHIGLVLTILAGIANVVLDYVFMAIFGMGTAGAALGTVLGQSIIAISGLLYFAFQRKGTLYFVKAKFNVRILSEICINGSSEMVSNLAYAITTFMFNIIMLELLQEQGVAAITIILYAQYVLSSIFMGFANGVAPIISYQYGRQDHEQIKNLYKMARRIITGFSILVLVLAFVFATPLIMIFTPKGSEIFDLTLSGFYIFSICFLFSGTNIFASSLFTAFSNGKVSACISFLRSFVCIVLSLLILPNMLGINGVWLAIPCAEFVSFLVALYLFKKYKGVYHY